MCVSNNLHLLRSQEGKEALSYGFKKKIVVERQFTIDRLIDSQVRKRLHSTSKRH